MGQNSPSCRAERTDAARLMRGRHFAFLAILCTSWMAGRIGIAFLRPGAINQITAMQYRPTTTLLTTPHRMIGRPLQAAGITPKCCLMMAPHFSRQNKTIPFVLRKMQPPRPQDSLTLAPHSPQIVFTATPSTPVAPSLIATKDKRKLVAQYYAYSFWRANNGASGLANGGQYGGSQSGMIATFALQDTTERLQPQRLALLVRAAISHRDPQERELATGARWRPSPKLPVTITAERRFRNARSDAFAIYAAGGVSDLPLPMKFRLDTFGQAGAVSGKGGGKFFDGIVRADRKIVVTSNVAVHAGAGMWAGGQRDIMRVDVGPSLRTDIAVRDINFRLTADWRFRVAGNVNPGNGPAITLSTSF